MANLNRDTIIALGLLVFTSILAWATFQIRTPDYGTLPPSAWPQLIVAALALFSLIYLAQSLGAGPDPEPQTASEDGFVTGFLRKYRNPIFCYIIYFAFLMTLPIFGALIGGIFLVFLLLSVMGGWAPTLLLKHAVIAVVSMGFMWALFTFGLRVILPQGMIFTTL